MSIIKNISQESELKDVANTLIGHIEKVSVILLNGNMGAGKTTFVKYFCKELGIEDSASSPTFSIVNEYHSPKFGNIYHFDLYRLKDLEEAFDIGIEDYLYSGNICLIEWPDVIKDILPEKYIEVNIEVENNHRNFIIKPPIN